QAMSVSAVERARPNIQRIVFVRRQPAQSGTVRRHFRIRPPLIAEQDYPRDKWRQFRVNGEAAKPDDRKEKVSHMDWRVLIRASKDPAQCGRYCRRAESHPRARGGRPV